MKMDVRFVRVLRFFAGEGMSVDVRELKAKRKVLACNP